MTGKTRRGVLVLLLGLALLLPAAPALAQSAPANDDFGSATTISAPPSNDNFSNATQVTALPFTDTVDTTAATLEPGEPAPCTFPPLDGSAWYAFTPTSSESVSASISSPFFSLQAAYTGTSIDKLTSLGCGLSDEGPLTIHVNAGTTYYFQVGGFGAAGPITFQLAVPAPPTAAFSIAPGDPSIFDTIDFSDESSDPANAGIRAEAWDFGDGTTGAGGSPRHQYAADGDYTVKLTITTTDGRTATTSQVIHVVTHDVAITTFTVPTSARPGTTHSITVGVSDKRYPETVQVQLLKGNIQGFFDVIGTMTLPVPAKAANHMTQFSFSYTFTSGDAAIGKVTFEVIATIQGARDALPADNIAIATTKVR